MNALWKDMANLKLSDRGMIWNSDLVETLGRSQPNVASNSWPPGASALSVPKIVRLLVVPTLYKRKEERPKGYGSIVKVPRA
jgi:hypothetical protein